MRNSSSYMKLLDIPLGLIINFHEKKLINGVARMILPGPTDRGVNTSKRERFEKRCESGVKVPQFWRTKPLEFRVKAMNGKV
jgi:hypothetical protein